MADPGYLGLYLVSGERKEVMRVIEIVGSRKATPEELKNAPGAATPKGQSIINIHLHYETDKLKSQEYWRGIGLEMEHHE